MMKKKKKRNEKKKKKKNTKRKEDEKKRKKEEEEEAGQREEVCIVYKTVTLSLQHCQSSYKHKTKQENETKLNKATQNKLHTDKQIKSQTNQK